MQRFLTIIVFSLLSFIAKTQNDDVVNFDTSLNRSNEIKMQQWISTHNYYNAKQIITIPVVVHVVYFNTAQNLSDARILEQIAVLNSCFNDSTPDAPVPFDTVAANCEIRFCLAQITPGGDSTNGIDRKQTTVTSFTTDDHVKYTSTGGSDAWDVTKYLNIWVCNLGFGFSGYAEFPTGTPSNTDGVVMHYQYFGVTGASYPYNGGKSTVHELGHWLNLYHICCSSYYLGCPDVDGCADTPSMNTEIYSCSPPPPPASDSCTSTPMYGNFMQVMSDDCLTFFTNDQKDRMHACLNTLRPWLLTSDVCNPIVENINNNTTEINSVFLSPNPSEGLSTLHFEAKAPVQMVFKIIDMTGRTINIFSQEFPSGKNEIQINIQDMNEGIYFLQIKNESFSTNIKMIKF